jgi:enterochelin esterase-like enzyme
MTGNVQTLAIMSAGMKALRETLGILEAEIFITNIKTPGHDYTKWRENLWEDLTLRELLEKAAEAEKNHGVPEGVVRV